MERGVVFTVCKLRPNEDETGFEMLGGIQDEELNYLTLYWDRLVSPTNNIFHFTFKNEDELIKCGLLTRPKYVQKNGFYAGDMPNFFANIHVDALSMMRKEQGDIDWRMHFFDDKVSIPSELSRKKEVVRFELDNLLPVPPVDTPLHDILEFKERRKAELLALHGYLDELYEEVLKAGDFNLQRAKALSGLKAAINDLNELNKHYWQSPIKFNFSSSFEFDLNQLVGSAEIIHKAMQSSKPFESFLTEAAITVLGGLIKVKPQFQSVINKGNPKLAYITNARREGIISD
ncbi:DUF6236 family protein [Kosakonia sacchari]